MVPFCLVARQMDGSVRQITSVSRRIDFATSSCNIFARSARMFQHRWRSLTGVFYQVPPYTLGRNGSCPKLSKLPVDKDGFARTFGTCRQWQYQQSRPAGKCRTTVTERSPAHCGGVRVVSTREATAVVGIGGARRCDITDGIGGSVLFPNLLSDRVDRPITERPPISGRVFRYVMYVVGSTAATTDSRSARVRSAVPIGLPTSRSSAEFTHHRAIYANGVLPCASVFGETTCSSQGMCFRLSCDTRTVPRIVSVTAGVSIRS